MSNSTKKDQQKMGAIRGKLPLAPETGPLYEVTKNPHFIHGREYRPGEKVYYQGVPGRLLKPLNDEAKKATQDRDRKGLGNGMKAAGKSEQDKQEPPKESVTNDSGNDSNPGDGGGDAFLDRPIDAIKEDLPALLPDELTKYREAELAGKARNGMLAAIDAEIAKRAEG